MTILHGALEMQDKTVRQAMTPIDKVLMLNFDEILNRKTLNRLARAGHSRVPVYKSIAPKEEQADEDKVTGSGPSGNELEKEAKAKDGETGTKAQGKELMKDKEIVGVLLVKVCSRIVDTC